MRKKLLGLSRSRHYVRRGFSLPETLIALIILSIAILAIAFVPIMSSKMAVHFTQKDQAMFHAMRTLDFLEAQPHNAGILSEDHIGDYVLSFQKPVFNETSPDLHVGKVTVTWRGVSGQSSLTLQRLLSKFSSSTRGE